MWSPCIRIPVDVGRSACSISIPRLAQYNFMLSLTESVGQKITERMSSEPS